MSSKVRNAGPFQKAFKQHEQSWFIERLEPVRKSLEESGVLNSGLAVLNSSKVLALLSAGVLQLQQNVLGKQSLPANRKMTLLPEALFRDFDANGALFSILAESVKFLARVNVAVHSFVKFVQQESVEAQSTSYMDMLLNIKFELEQRGLLPQYRIHFARSIPSKSVSALSAIIKAHGGELVSSRHACTHQIVPHPSHDAASLGQGSSAEALSDNARTLELKDGMVLTHWCCFPPSHREWLPASEIEGKSEQVRSTPPRWNVSARFIYDLDVFNEWMDELDYQSENHEEDDAELADDALESGRKRVGDSDASEFKRSKVADSEPSPPRQLSFTEANKVVGISCLFILKKTVHLLTSVSRRQR
jgi:hypothetical protein